MELHSQSSRATLTERFMVQIHLGAPYKENPVRKVGVYVVFGFVPRQTKVRQISPRAEFENLLLQGARRVEAIEY